MFPLKSDHFVKGVEKKMGDKTEKVVVYCQNYDCDAFITAAKKLDEAGFKNVLDFEGGIDEWKRKGFAVESNA